MQSIDSLKVLVTIFVLLDDINLCTPSCTFSNILGANLVREREISNFLYICMYSLPTYGYRRMDSLKNILKWKTVIESPVIEIINEENVHNFSLCNIQQVVKIKETMI